MINEYYVQGLPLPQNTIDLFPDEWSSKFPGDWELIRDGDTRLFQDGRIEWFKEMLIKLEDKFRLRSILELGPLEGGHSYMLSRSGYHVTAIEANSRAYLKCLAIQNIHKYPVDFLLGDFNEYLKLSKEKFDAVLACGVLYHQQNPVELIMRLSKITARLMIWTHYTNPIKDMSEYDYDGNTYSYRDNYYGTHLPSFCGGLHEYGRWLTLGSLYKALDYYGYENVETNFDQPDHPNGPAIAIMAWK